jgi:hypothetical protein
MHKYSIYVYRGALDALCLNSTRYVEDPGGEKCVVVNVRDDACTAILIIIEGQFTVFQ